MVVVTINLKDTLGQPVSCGVKFTPTSTPFGDAGSVIIGASRIISTDAAGLATINIEQGNYTVNLITPNCTDQYGITVPSNGGPYSLTDLIVSGINPLATLVFVPSDTQTDWTARMTSIDDKTPNLGQSNKAGSVPVTLASDQTISATIGLPTGAATASAQTTAQTSLSSIDTKTPALGAAAKASSIPVNIASDQIVPMSDGGTVGVTSVAITANGQSTAAIPVAGFNSVSVLAYGTFSTVNITPQISADGGTTWQGVLLTRLDATSSSAALTTGNQSAAYSFTFPTMGTTHCRFTSTAWTSGTQTLRVTPSLTSPLPAYLATLFNATQNVAIGGNTSTASVANGSTNKALGVATSTAIAQTDQSATAFAGSGRIGGTVVASAMGGGVSCAFDINLTITTIGTATAMVPVLSESYDSGTTYTDVWTGTPMTATGHQRVPAIPICGRRKWSFMNVGGTSTTAPATIIAQELPGVNILQRQFVDIYAATNPTASVINGTSTASTLVSTTLSSTSGVALIEGCGRITIGGVFTGGTPTTAPVYTLQVSNDATNWKSTTCTVSPTAAGYFTSDLTLVGAYRYARLIVTTASAGGTPYGVTYTAINGIQ